MSGVAAGYLASSLYWLLVLSRGQLKGTPEAATTPLDVVNTIRIKLKKCVKEINKYSGLHEVLSRVDMGSKYSFLLLLLVFVVGLFVVAYYFRRRLLKRGQIWVHRLFLQV